MSDNPFLRHVQTSGAERQVVWPHAIDAMYQNGWNAANIGSGRNADDLALAVTNRMAVRGQDIRLGYTRYGVVENVRARLGDLFYQYPTLDPLKPDTWPQDIYVKLDPAKRYYLSPPGFQSSEPTRVPPPDFDVSALPWYEKALVPVAWVASWFFPLSSLAKIAVVVFVLLVLLFIF